MQQGSVELQRHHEPAHHTVASGQFGEVAHGAFNAGTNSAAIAAFHLIDADSGKSIAPFSPLQNDGRIRLSALAGKRFTIVATVTGIVGSVMFRTRFEDGDLSDLVEENPPYTLTGNRPVSMIDAAHAVDRSVMVAYNDAASPPSNADLYIHHSPRVRGKPWIESEGEAPQAPGEIGRAHV